MEQVKGNGEDFPRECRARMGKSEARRQPCPWQSAWTAPCRVREHGGACQSGSLCHRGGEKGRVSLRCADAAWNDVLSTTGPMRMLRKEEGRPRK